MESDTLSGLVVGVCCILGILRSNDRNAIGRYLFLNTCFASCTKLHSIKLFVFCFIKKTACAIYENIVILVTSIIAFDSRRTYPNLAVSCDLLGVL